MNIEYDLKLLQQFVDENFVYFEAFMEEKGEDPEQIYENLFDD